MIQHIVLFNLKAEIEVSERDWLFAQIQGLSKISTVRRLAIGKLLEPREDWYKTRLSTEYGWVLSVEFDDESALYTYQQHPDHVTVAQEIRKRVAGTKILDFVSVG
jgi:hypothetical protein